MITPKRLARCVAPMLSVAAAVMFSDSTVFAQSVTHACRPAEIIPLTGTEPAAKLVIDAPLAEPLASRGVAARGYIHDFHSGAVKLIADRERGVLIGATLVTPRAGEIVAELVLAIKLQTPLTTLADVIHPFPAFNRVLGATIEELATKTVMQRVA